MPHTRTPRRTPLAAALLIALLATIGPAACGSSSTTAQTAANASATGTTTARATTTTAGATSSGTSSTPTASAGRPAAGHFAGVRECLAKKGIALPRRSAGGLFNGAQLPKGVTHAQYAEALKSCDANFRGNHFRRVPRTLLSSRFHQVLARFAACLRHNGIDVGEPNTSGKGPIFNTKGLNTGSPQFRAASVKCRSTLLGGTRPKTSPGAGGSATG